MEPNRREVSDDKDSLLENRNLSLATVDEREGEYNLLAYPGKLLVLRRMLDITSLSVIDSDVSARVDDSVRVDESCNEIGV